MKFRCEKKVIVKEIEIAANVISGKKINTPLNVYLKGDTDRLNIKATDLEIHFEVNLPLLIEVNGEVTVPIERFLKALKSFPAGDILFEVTGDLLEIKAEGKDVKFHFNCSDPETYPEFRKPEQENFFDLSQKDFKEMFRQVIRSAGKEDSRFFLNGIFLEKKELGFAMVTTDGKRLSYIEKELSVPDFKNVIVPTKIFELVDQLIFGEGNIQVNIEEKAIFIKFENKNFYSTLIEGTFPDYRRGIPSETIDRMVLNRESFIESLKRVSIMAEEKTGRIGLTFSKESLKIRGKKSSHGDSFEMLEATDFQSDDVSAEYDFRFFLDAVGEMKGKDKVEINFAPDYKPLTIKPYPEEDYFHLLMPLQH